MASQTTLFSSPECYLNYTLYTNLSLCSEHGGLQIMGYPGGEGESYLKLLKVVEIWLVREDGFTWSAFVI